MVVSEMKERLSPKNAPPVTTAVINAGLLPVSAARAPATGTRAAIVPTLVPMDIEMKQAAMNIPANRRLGGRTLRVRSTVASMAPISLAVSANAPARTNIHIISSTLWFPAPEEKTEIFSSKFFPLVMHRA